MENFMNNDMNRFWTLVATPTTPWPDGATYLVVESAIPTPGPNQALTKTIYVSLDPYQWGRQRRGSDVPGIPCHARTVSQVLVSHIEGIAPGDFVFNTNGWAEYGLIGEGVQRPSYMIPRKLDPVQSKISNALDVLGILGLTAYAGMILQCVPQSGETVVVSAASGGVGQIAGQLAKLRGCRVVGIAGREEKCRYVINDLGFDACVSHLSSTFAADLKSACPQGIDVYFENVGSTVFQAVLPLFNPGARMTICGLIAHYGDETPADVANIERRAAEALGVKVQSLSVGDYVEGWHDTFVTEMAPHVVSGRIRYLEDVREGFESIPASFAAMLKGSMFGKTLVRLSPDPTLEVRRL
jgi:NADPH-dependent curcumin reductase CurA